MKFQINQPIYYIPPSEGEGNTIYPEWLTVCTNGTGWVYLSNGHKMNTKTLEVDNGGQCYLSEQDFLDSGDSDISPTPI